MTRTLRAILLAASALALYATPAVAADLDANPAAPDGAANSLRQLIQVANPNDTIRLAPGTYRLTQGPLVIDEPLNLLGLGGRAAEVVITPEGRSHVMTVSAAAGTVSLAKLQVSGGRVTGGTGGGILKQNAGSLVLTDVHVTGNTATGSQGGGGLAVSAGIVNIRRSALSANAATVSVASGGGGGILHTGGTLDLDNASLAGNRVTVSGSPANAGGSAILSNAGSLSLDSVTIGYNTTSPGGLGALRAAAAVSPTLLNTIVSNNGGNCVGNFNSLGFNIDGDVGCDLDATGDQPAVVPNIQPLADNGGPTPTLRLPPGSLAINTGTCSLSEDQRLLVRPAENESDCDVGAFEFEGWARVDVPPCSRSGRLPFTIDSPPQAAVEALDYTLDGGNVNSPLRVPVSGGSSATGVVQVPEGRRRLEYWADSTPTGTDSGVQLKHVVKQAVVDRTNPRVAVSNPNEFRVFVIKRRTSVNVAAADSISGLVSDPSGRRAIDTSERGAKTFAPGAVDLCANTATAPFSYRVLAPGLGVRAVLERVRGTVLARPPAGGSARASQKGRRFTSFREPREVAIRSLVNARRGTVRVTSSRNSRTDVQDAEFSGGLFQVLQSRSRRARGLTELRLKGASFRSCRSARGRRASTSARRRVIRRLRGRGRGRFRTRGRYSAATVRGTTWTVEDRCDGTLTRVTSGRVAVRDFRRRRTVIVRAGKSYLARAPR